MVEPIRKSTRQEREQWLKEAHYNVFQLKSEQVYIDLITDSGTGAMSDRQWAAMMLGDESYAGASSFFNLKEVITRLTGFEYVIPTHQGRAAENVLFSYLVHEGDIVPGNSHFDTTKGHIEGRKAIALDCTIDEAKNTQLEIPFKGNVDPVKLEKHCRSMLTVYRLSSLPLRTTRPADSPYPCRTFVKSVLLRISIINLYYLTPHVLRKMLTSSKCVKMAIAVKQSRKLRKRCSNWQMV